MKNQLYHVPDLKFTRWCESTFAVNRGVYNIIDEKLYEMGIHDILERRQAIIQFLKQNVQPTTENKYYKFGQGNLAEALIQFKQSYTDSNNILKSLQMYSKDEHVIEGCVIRGKQLGRTIGFPTANLQVEKEVALQQGVYAVQVQLGERDFIGVMNVGVRPSFKDGEHITYEVHILNFDEEIYGEILKIAPVFFIRHEQKFENIQALITQLQRDVDEANQLLGEFSYDEQHII